MTVMRRGGTWVDRLKSRLKNNGYTILDVAPGEMAAQKRRSRRQDRSRIARRLATPAQIQKANTLFPGVAERGRVVGFGGPNREP